MPSYPLDGVQYTQGALFAVTKRVVQGHPKEFYQRVYDYFNGIEETNPEEGHYMERFWLAIFEDGRKNADLSNIWD